MFLVYRLKRRVLKKMYLLTLGGRQAEPGQPTVQAASTTSTDGEAGDETKPLLSSMFFYYTKKCKALWGKPE